MAYDLRHCVLRKLTPPFVFFLILLGTSCPSRQRCVGLEEGAGGPVGFEPVAGKRGGILASCSSASGGARHRRRQNHSGVVIPAPRACKYALPIEQSIPGFANSRVRAPPHVHPRGLGSRPSSLRGLNEELYKKKFKTKKSRLLEDRKRHFAHKELSSLCDIKDRPRTP